MGWHGRTRADAVADAAAFAQAAARFSVFYQPSADGRLPADIDWPSIADPGATTVVYMPVKTHAAFAQASQGGNHYVAAGREGDGAI